MSDTETRTINQLPLAVVVEPGFRVPVQPAEGPTLAVDVERLFGKYLGTATAKATVDALLADLAHPADSLALVYADPSPDASGYYRKVGAAGAGTWQLTRVYRGEKGETGAPAEIVVSRAALKAIAGMAEGDGYRLIEEGRKGMFVWRLGNFAASVASDPYEGMYIQSDTVAATVGCWVRQLESLTYQATWFGVSESNNATNHLRIRSMEALRLAGSTVEFPAGDFTGFGTGAAETMVVIGKPGRYQGAEFQTAFTAAAGVVRTMFAIATSDFTFDGIKLEGLRDPSNADGRFCLDIGVRFGSVSITDAKQVENIRVRAQIGNCDMGVRVINAGHDDGTGARWYHPRRIKLDVHLYSIAYQGLSLWGRQIDAEARIEMDPMAGTRPFQTPVRLSGVSNSDIKARIYDPKGLPAFIVTPTSEDSQNGSAGAEFNDPRNLRINFYAKGRGSVARVYGWSGNVHFSQDCHYDHTGKFTETAETTAFVFSNGGEDQKAGDFVVDGGLYEGFVHVATQDLGAFKSIIFKEGRSGSNARTAPASLTGVFDTSYVEIAGYSGSPVEPIENFQVTNWDHSAHAGVTLFGVKIGNKSADSFFRVRNNIWPEGMAAFIAITSGTAAPNSEGGNEAYPAGHHARMLSNYTGYAASPRYSDNGPNGGGPAIFDPDYGLTPDPVEEDQ